MRETKETMWVGRKGEFVVCFLPIYSCFYNVSVFIPFFGKLLGFVNANLCVSEKKYMVA